MRIKELIPEAVNVAKFGDELYNRFATLLPVKQENDVVSDADINQFFEKFKQIYYDWASKQYWNQEPKKSEIIAAELNSLNREDLGIIPDIDFDMLGSFRGRYLSNSFRIELNKNLIVELLLMDSPDVLDDPMMAKNQQYILRKIVSTLVHELTHFIQHISRIKDYLEKEDYSEYSYLFAPRSNASRKSFTNMSKDRHIEYLGRRIEITARANQFALLILRDLKKQALRNSGNDNLSSLNSQDILRTINMYSKYLQLNDYGEKYISTNSRNIDHKVKQAYQKVRQRLLKQAYQIIIDTLKNHPENIKKYFDAPLGTKKEKNIETDIYTDMYKDIEKYSNIPLGTNTPIPADIEKVNALFQNLVKKIDQKN